MRGGNGFIPKDEGAYIVNIPEEKWSKNLKRDVNKKCGYHTLICELAKDSYDVYERLKKSQSHYPFFFEIEKICGCTYEDEDITAWYVPVSFNISVKYKGKKYLSENISKIEDICAVGEYNDDYAGYLAEIERLGKEKNFCKIPNIFYNLASICCILMGIFLILVPVMANGNVADEIIQGSLYVYLRNAWGDGGTFTFVGIQGLLFLIFVKVGESKGNFGQKHALDYKTIMDEEDINGCVRKRYLALLKRRTFISIMALLFTLAVDCVICFV